MAGAEAPAAPAAPATPEPSAPEPSMGDDMGAAPADDKPFDDTPFDAGVEADEESDPKKFIEQLTGKLGQSLRTYTESQGGQPDFDLEKFAINSLLSATHTAEMTPEDQKDIINKVKKSGAGDGDTEPEADSGMPNDDMGGESSMDKPADDLGGDPSMDEPVDDLGESINDGGIISEFINTDKLKPLANKEMYSQAELDMILGMIYNSVDVSGQYRLMDVITTLNLPSAQNFLQEGKTLTGATAFPWRYEGGENSGDANGEMGNLFLNEIPKNNLFQPGTEITEACWKGYRQVGMKEKDGKTVPNCVPINEEGMHAGDSQNYMFWQNLKTINHASGELLNMDQSKVDEMIKNGHAWAVDHISTSSDDVEEVYHFFEANLSDLKTSKESDKHLQKQEKFSIFDKDSLRQKLTETFNQEDPMIEPQVAPAPEVKPSIAPSPTINPKRKNQPFLPMPDIQPDPKAEI